jgi:hypothetical protein
MKTKPSYLNLPCGKSRAAILAWLRSFKPRYYDGDSWQFCFNVKCGGVDLSLQNLARLHRESGYGEKLTPQYVEACREKYEEEENNLFEWGQEDACRTFTGRDGKPDDDAYNMTWKGTPVETEFAFYGRSGGWLTFTYFNGHKLTRNFMDQEGGIEEMPWQELKDLAEMVRFIEYTTEGRKPEEAIERAAAFTFFENICSEMEEELETEVQTQLAQCWP